MRKVEIMKRAIADHMSAAGGGNAAYKWTAHREGLHWSYDVDFTLQILTEYDADGKPCLYAKAESAEGVRDVVAVVTDPGLQWLIDSVHDFEATPEDALYWVARRIMRKAERVY